jgi:hypothetical protein
MKRLAPLCVVALLVPTLVLAASLPGPNAPATPEQLRQKLAELMREQDIPGASYAVFDRNGTVLTGSLGLWPTTEPAPWSARTRSFASGRLRRR